MSPEEAQLATSLTTLWTDVFNLLRVAVGDWRYWFAHLVTWAAVARLKWLWDFLPRRKRYRLNELLATLMAGGLSVWVFWGSPGVAFFAVSNGLANTYLFKFAVYFLEKFRPEWAMVIKSRDYQMVSLPDGGAKLIRDGAHEAIVLSAEEAETYRKWEGRPKP